MKGVLAEVVRIYSRGSLGSIPTDLATKTELSEDEVASTVEALRTNTPPLIEVDGDGRIFPTQDGMNMEARFGHAKTMRPSMVTEAASLVLGSAAIKGGVALRVLSHDGDLWAMEVTRLVLASGAMSVPEEFARSERRLCLEHGLNVTFTVAEVVEKIAVADDDEEED